MSGTVCVLETNKREERRHTRPIRERLRLIEMKGTMDIPDEHQARDSRILTLAHSYEAFALWGLRLAAQRNLVVPPSHFVGFDLAPAELEKGVRHPQYQNLKEPGIDLVMTMNPKATCPSRYPLLGLNIKASQGSGHSGLLWYSPRIDTLALNLHVGRWPVSTDGRICLRHVFKDAIRTDEGTQRLLSFMERNIEPFGSFLLNQTANRVYACRTRMERGEDRHIRMFPEGEEPRSKLYAQVGQLCTVFEASGIHSTRKSPFLQNNTIQNTFLPTTPLS